MPHMKLDAVSVTSTNFAKTVQFYSLLGFAFPEFTPGEKHLEALTPAGGVRLMIDDKELIQGIIGREPLPATHSSFAILCATPADVDAAAAAVQNAGFTVIKDPWDAFWGQRYAIVADPDGYLADLFAPLAPS